MDKLFYDVSAQTSRNVTKAYSTSFSVGVRCLDRSIREAVYCIYGFVRLADEIVDTFHEYDKATLFDRFVDDYRFALANGISLNPILNSFQHTVSKYRIPHELVGAFLDSMRSDLHRDRFDEKQIREYIYGSADAVGLMCLRVFVDGDAPMYEQLKPYAQRLGSAFQKINFLRDIGHDTHSLHRTYFPQVAQDGFTETVKNKIVEDIMEDYRVAFEGIKQLPDTARLGVYVAYLYYKRLTEQIVRTPVERLEAGRVRVSNGRKLLLLAKGYWRARILRAPTF